MIRGSAATSAMPVAQPAIGDALSGTRLAIGPRCGLVHDPRHCNRCALSQASIGPAVNATYGCSRVGRWIAFGARPGRTARTRSAVFGATLSELVQRGYDGRCRGNRRAGGGAQNDCVSALGFEESAGAEALEDAAESRIGAPDTGNLEQDLRLLARAVQRTISSPEGVAAVHVLISGARSSSEAGQLVQRFWSTRLSQIGPVVERAIDRGEIPPGTRASRVIEHLAAPLYYRLLIAGELPIEADADLAAAAVLVSARTGVFVTN